MCCTNEATTCNFVRTNFFYPFQLLCNMLYTFSWYEAIQYRVKWSIILMLNVGNKFLKLFSNYTYLQLQHGVHNIPNSVQISSNSTQHVFESPIRRLNPINYIIQKYVINKLITNWIINSNLQGCTSLFLCSLYEWFN